MSHRCTVGTALDLAGGGTAIKSLRPPAAVLTEGAAAIAGLGGALVEPMDRMCEAVLALCVCDPGELTGKVCYSLSLLERLQRPVYDLHGETLVDGWQPADIPARIAAQG